MTDVINDVNMAKQYNERKNILLVCLLDMKRD